jgi:hypothetical protein
MASPDLAPVGAGGIGPVLQFGEAELRLHDPATGLRRSPLVAVLDGSEPVFGEAALDTARRDPRQLAEGYLRDLGTDALGLRGAPHLSRADLLYRHLGTFAAGAAPGVFVVSPALADETLGLLLGIALRAGLQPRALVDAAVLAASLASHPREHVLHVEPGLHDGTLTHVLQDDDQPATGAGGAARGAVLRVPGLGLRSARELWLRHVRERGIALWRIDPLLDPARAAVVQAAWPAASAALARGEDGALAFDAGHQLDWTAAEVLARIHDAARGLVDAVLAQSPADGVVLLDPAMAELPGVAALIARHRDTRMLEANAYPEALVRLAPALGLAGPAAAAADTAGVAHLLRLPRAHAASGWRPEPRPHVTPLALLLVLGERAHALAPGAHLRLRCGAGMATLQAGPGDPSAHADDAEATLQVHTDHVLLDCPSGLGTRVNGGPVLAGRTVLRPGDRVQTRDGAALLLVALAATDAQRHKDGRHEDRQPRGL